MSDKHANKNRIGNRLAMVQTNAEAWLAYLRTIFYFKQEADVVIKQSDSTGIIAERTIPNAFKLVNISVLNGVLPPVGYVKGEFGNLYINTKDKSTWICLGTGVDYWLHLTSSEELDVHNTSNTAHKNYIARINGDATKIFNVKNANDALNAEDEEYNYEHLEYNNRQYLDLLPENKKTTVNVNYVGRLEHLDTYINTTIVDALNEIYEYANTVDAGFNEYGGIQKGALNKGNINNIGNADIINSNLTDVARNTVPGTYYLNVDANDIVTIELVGGGGARAYINGDSSNYADALAGIQYWHEGGSGGYFRGVFKAPSAGILRVVTPSKGTDGSGNDIVNMTGIYTLPTVGTGGDAVAIFTPTNGSAVEIARARGGAPGYPAYSSGFWASVAGGTVTYNSSYFYKVETAVTGTSGNVWGYYPESTYYNGQVIFESGETSTSVTLANSGIYEIIAVSGGSGGITYDTGAAWWINYIGGTGAYYNGKLRLTKGTYSVSIGGGGHGGNYNAQAGGLAAGGGGSTTLGSVFSLIGAPGYVTDGGGGYLNSVSGEVSRIAYSAGYGANGYSTAENPISRGQQLGPSNNYGLGDYGRGGGTQWGGGTYGSGGYLKIIYRGIH